MEFSSPLTRGTLIKRYKRFLVDVRLEDGTEVTAHVANTGSMRGCAEPGLPVAMSHHPGKGRKFPFSLELVRVGSTWVGVNTVLANVIAEDAIRMGLLPALAGYATIRREVRYGRQSRIDLLLSGDGPDCYVEVKNVTLRVDDVAAFPDAVTARGRKHLLALEHEVVRGNRAVMLFLVNRDDCRAARPAADIDPAYASALRRAVARGVEVVACGTRADLRGIVPTGPLPFFLDGGGEPTSSNPEGRGGRSARVPERPGIVEPKG